MAKEFNTDLIVFTKPQKEDTYYRAKMTFGNQDPVILQTPPLSLVSRDGTLLELSLSDRSAKSIRFYEQISRVDDLALRTLSNQSESWFQKKIPMDKLKTMYQPCVAPTQVPTINHLRFRLAKNLRIFQDSPDTEISFGELQNLGCRVSCILRFEGILIAGGRARLDVRVAQILTVRPKEATEPPKKPEEPAVEYDSDAGCTFDPCPAPPHAVQEPLPSQSEPIPPIEPATETPATETLATETLATETAKRLRSELARVFAESPDDLDLIGDIVSRLKNLGTA